MHSVNLFVIILIVVGVSLFGLTLYVNSEPTKTRRYFGKQAVQTIQNCCDGDSNKIVGTLQTFDFLKTAPITKRKCALFAVVVKQWFSSSNGGNWHLLNKDIERSNFLIEGEGHYAYVLSDSALLVLADDETVYTQDFKELPEELSAYLSRQKIKTADQWSVFKFKKALRITEKILEPNERVSVFGPSAWRRVEEFPELAFLSERGVSKVLVFNNTKRKRLYLSDDPTLFTPKKSLKRLLGIF